MKEATPAKGALIAGAAILLIGLTVIVSIGFQMLAIRWLGSGNGRFGLAASVPFLGVAWVGFLRWCGYEIPWQVLWTPQEKRKGLRDDGDSD